MITFEDAMQAIESEAVTSLRMDALEQDDFVNLVLQRSEVIRDQPKYNRYIRAWMSGDSTPLNDLIDQIGPEVIARRAAAFIYLEYLQLRPIFEAKAPKSIADIGCGYAMFDLFLARDFGSVLHLIDLESNDTRHFGFEEEAAAYSSLKVAKKLLTDNGVPAKSIKTLNPEKQDVLKLKKLDFAFSFISCGFHYPWDTYRDFFLKSVAPDGRIILDIRSKVLNVAVRELSEIGYVRSVEMAAGNTADRVMIAKLDGI
ncbi:class I SAM-dependent methyltransferase [uncultured Tateyamaria sp.]|uniref:class I SAM-dependent methyltransferase n=1 Tax=uncultured Tateyamaria sp. TaxID=455651 RepID=UPI002617C6CE|nr:class I SAM-dependent methyltransferase [uncultured Tateyamaria sp.]